MARFLGWAVVAIALLAALGGGEALRPPWDLFVGVVTLVLWALLALVGLVAVIVGLRLTWWGTALLADIWAWRNDALNRGGGIRAGGLSINAQLSERDMVNLLATYPEELLGESLTFERREVPVRGGRLDLLFRCGGGRAQLLGVEVKRGPVTRDDVGQVMDYLIPLEKQYGRAVVRLMLVAPVIAPDRRAALKRARIECCEIAETRFVQIGLECGYFQSQGRR